MSRLGIAALAIAGFGLGFMTPTARHTDPAAPVAFERVERPEPTVELWVGALCRDGRMIVSPSRAALQEADCRDEWHQTLTEAQVRGLSR